MRLLVVGGGLFGSLAAAYARHRGVETTVFDAGLPGAASPAAGGLFKEAWLGRKFAPYYRDAIAVLESLYPIQDIELRCVGQAFLPAEEMAGRNACPTSESFHFIPPLSILETNPVREEVTAIGDGWLEAGGRRHEGAVYIAAGVWCQRFAPDLDIVGKAGAAFLFAGERPGRIQSFGSRQAQAFVRDPGSTYFNDGTAERDFTNEHERQSLERAAAMGMTEPPIRRLWGVRPYTPGRPVFRRIHSRTWLATGGRKVGTIVGAAFARRLVEEL
jgi:glycine/D-amino acid oxidase-like deaminating enzyme